jgi:carbon monoxide dehydrogenase subunit G
MKIVNRIDVRATPEAVFHWLEDPERAMQWMTSVTRSEIIKETPSRVGTTFREYIEEDGRGTEMHGVVTEFVSNERFAVHLEGDFNSVDVSFSLEEKAGVTQLTQNVQLSFKGMLKVLSAFLRVSIKKKIVNQAQKELAKLKELCERKS